MNARQKLKKLKQENDSLKLYLDELGKSNKMLCARISMLREEISDIKSGSEEFCCYRILSPTEYKTIDKETLKAFLAAELTEVIKDRLRLFIRADDPREPGYYKAYARIRIFSR